MRNFFLFCLLSLCSPLSPPAPSSPPPAPHLLPPLIAPSFYLVRSLINASVILNVGLQPEMRIPASEQWREKNNDTQWDRTKSLRTLSQTELIYIVTAFSSLRGCVKLIIISIKQKILALMKKWENICSHCYVAVCNNYAICNKLQTALNCSAVCNTSYFRLRCDGNAICNVLQIASKFYHLKILKRRKKIAQRQNASLQSYLTMNSVRHQSIRARHAKVLINTTIVQNAILPPHFCEVGGIKNHLSVRLLVCLPIPLSVAKF